VMTLRTRCSLQWSGPPAGSPAAPPSIRTTRPPSGTAATPNAAASSINRPRARAHHGGTESTEVGFTKPRNSVASVPPCDQLLLKVAPEPTRLTLGRWGGDI